MKEQNYYCVIPASILEDKTLNSQQKLLYAAITSLINKRGYFFGSNQYLEQLMSLSSSTLKRNLQKLEESGYIEREVVRNEKGEITERRIFATLGSKMGRPRLKNGPTPGPKNEPTPRAKNGPYNSKEIVNIKDVNIKLEHNISKGRVNEIFEAEVIELYPFEDFWNLYDKKVSRPKCEKKYNNLTEGQRAQIFETLPAYLKATPDKKYRKNPETYLNNQSWNDEIIQENGNTENRTREQKTRDIFTRIKERQANA